MGWQLLPEPLMAAVSIASASKATDSARNYYSMSGVDCSSVRRENLMEAPTVFGLIKIVPIVPVESVTLQALSAPNQHAVAIPGRLYLENISNPE